MLDGRKHILLSPTSVLCIKHTVGHPEMFVVSLMGHTECCELAYCALIASHSSFFICVAPLEILLEHVLLAFLLITPYYPPVLTIKEPLSHVHGPPSSHALLGGAGSHEHSSEGVS